MILVPALLLALSLVYTIVNLSRMLGGRVAYVPPSRGETIAILLAFLGTLGATVLSFGLLASGPQHAATGQAWRTALFLGPIVASTLALALRRTGWRGAVIAASSAILSGWVIVSGFSVGLFYWPAAIAMFLAAELERRGRPV